MKNTLIALATTAAMMTSAHAASLTVVGADCDASKASVTAIALNCGSTTDRLASDNVNLGSADGSFYSLGLASDGSDVGGALLMQITPGFTGSMLVVEVTNPSKHWEAAAVYVGNSIDEVIANLTGGFSIGTLTNGKGGSEAAINSVIVPGTFTYVAFQDISRQIYGDSSVGNRTTDGFDIDALSVEAVPVPAAALLMGSGLVALGASRRKKKLG
ncbi:VPLPA-CTERM sorting domain-containing protein [Parvularcula sp. LCG005]|uniref:VPLPA-CTERM sorting domain-containing protein n=1 Tax=Parvularcula sp. LCG005 TaxID=3078805 RepID=UPI002942D3AF|nr:VPLPA-CTERM sorting domain-containing protein [Parvularcula sp. LCG005]WOI53641.1 VPLPA-CTERM sorting domain-containing protein [Parvularcula sp. LCG005]